MRTNRGLEIKLPEGCFEGNCSDCIYANWHSRHSIRLLNG